MAVRPRLGMVSVAAITPVLGAALALAVSAPAMAAGEQLVQARLLSETSALKPGGTAWLAVELTMKPGWHTYWRNPGDAGQPTDIVWQVPEGYEVGGVLWPTPKPIRVEMLTSYGYEDRVALLAPLVVPAAAKPGTTASVMAAVEWLACAKICIPGEAKVNLDLPIAADAPIDPRTGPRFAEARAEMPRPANAVATAQSTEDTITLSLPASLLGGGAKDVAFLPFDDALIDHNAPQRLALGDGAATLALKRGPRAGALQGNFPGVLLVRDASRQLAYDLTISMAAR